MSEEGRGKERRDGRADNGEQEQVEERRQDGSCEQNQMDK